MSSIILIIKEPDNHYKSILTSVVLKEHFAYRPSIGWYEWENSHWESVSDDEFEQILTRFMDSQNWKKRNSGDITSVIRALKSRLIVREENWNEYGKISFNNGTLNFITGEFISSHNQHDRLTCLRPYKFDLEAKCPAWLSFLLKVMDGNKDLINLIQAMFRHCCLPRRRDRKAEIEKSFDLFGRKGTGKGTTLDVLTNLVGLENIGSASVETFKNSVGLGQLLDKDLAMDSDVTGYLENVGNYNKVVSNEPVEVKKLYKDTFIARLGVVVVRAYNSFLSVPDGSEGLDRRMVIIPFLNSPKEIDTNLSQKLEAEISGIFAWCYSMNVAEMKQTILNAGSIQAISEMSVERFEANNPEIRFLMDTFPDGKDSVKAGDLHQSYVEWCIKNHHKPKTLVKFAPTIQSFDCKRSKGKINGCYYYIIPNMNNFDIPAHLGITKRQLGTVEDSYRDSSNLDTASIRDSRDSLDPIIDNQKENNSELYKSNNTPSTVPTVPNPDSVKITTIPKLSPTISTVSENNFKVGDRIQVICDGKYKSQLGTVQGFDYVNKTYQVNLDSSYEGHWKSEYLKLVISNVA